MREKDKNKSQEVSTKKDRSGLDVVESVKRMIIEEYPQMREKDATNLAVLLAKLELEDKI